MKRLLLVGLVLLGVGLWSIEENGKPTAQPVVLAASTDGIALRYTNLVCRELACYDGPYLEDGTDREVTGITALVLENTGTVGVLKARIEVVHKGKKLYFEADRIPPESTVLVLEQSRAPYSGPEIDGGRCLTLLSGNFGCAGEIGIRDEGMDLAVTNRTEEALCGIRLYYKQLVAGEEMYLGGVTYSAEIACLQPGETRRIVPYHYAAGYARVVAVEIG